VKENDHGMDALRYAVRGADGGRSVASTSGAGWCTSRPPLRW
jgi:hypothetical protein